MTLTVTCLQIVFQPFMAPTHLFFLCATYLHLVFFGCAMVSENWFYFTYLLHFIGIFSPESPKIHSNTSLTHHIELIIAAEEAAKRNDIAPIVQH